MIYVFFYFIDDQTSSPMFLRPSLLPSSSSFSFDIGQRKPDTPRPTSKSFSLNPSRLCLSTSISTRKLKILFLIKNISKKKLLSVLILYSSI